MDFYRLNDSNDILELGLDEYFYLDGLTVIEWSERATEILPGDSVAVEMKRKSDETRTVHFFTEKKA